MKLLDSLFLFKALIKAGCVWKEDISHRKWSERLYYEACNKDKVVEVLAKFDPVNDYKLDEDSVWIA